MAILTAVVIPAIVVRLPLLLCWGQHVTEPVFNTAQDWAPPFMPCEATAIAVPDQPATAAGVLGNPLPMQNGVPLLMKQVC
jgi:hypothetical protein